MYKKNKGKLSTKRKNRSKKTRKRTSKSKSKRNSRMHYGGSNSPILRILYNNVEIQNGENITDKNISKTIDIRNKPKVLVNVNVNVITNSKTNSRYLITMVDPDAPNGKNNTNQNHNYVHWIYLQEGNGNGNANSNTYDILQYAPPSPPSGIHRYKFNIYEISLENYETLKNIKSNVVNADRNKFYDDFFNTYINNKLISLYEFEYLMSKS